MKQFMVWGFNTHIGLTVWNCRKEHILKIYWIFKLLAPSTGCVTHCSLRDAQSLSCFLARSESGYIIISIALPDTDAIDWNKSSDFFKKEWVKKVQHISLVHIFNTGVLLQFLWVFLDHSPRHAKRFRLLFQSCKSECWPLRAPGRPTCCWARRWSLWLRASCCCTTASWRVFPHSRSTAVLRCRCPCSRKTVCYDTRKNMHEVLCCGFSGPTSLVSQMEMMKSKNGSSPACCPGELSWTCKIPQHKRWETGRWRTVAGVVFCCHVRILGLERCESTDLSQVVLRPSIAPSRG